MKRLVWLSMFLLSMYVVKAQQADVIVKNDGSSIKAYRIDYSGDVIYYQLEDAEESAIQRIKKEDVLNLPEANYVRVLGFNSKGQELLKSLKESESDELLSINDVYYNGNVPYNQLRFWYLR